MTVNILLLQVHCYCSRLLRSFLCKSK